MAGIAGMGQPQDIESPVPNVAELAQQAQQDAAPSPLPPQQPNDYVSQPQSASDDDLARIFSQVQGDHNSHASDADLEAIYNQTVSEDADSAVPKAPGIFQSNLTPSGIAQQIQDLPARAKASFGITDKEKLDSLKQSFGDENVKKAGDAFLVKDGGRWRRFDKNSGLLDLLANNARPLAEGTAAAAMTAAGGVMSLSGLGTPVGLATVAGAGMAAHLGGDAMQQALGIPHDPSRNYGVEGALSGAGNVVAAALPGVATKMFGSETANTAADMAASAQSSAQVAKGSADQVVKNNADQAIQDIDLLRKNFGFDMPQSAGSVMVGDDAVAAQRDKLAGTPLYKQYMRAAQAKLAPIADSIAQLVGDISGGAGKGTAAINKVSTLDQVEGKLVGDYRQMASKAAGDQELAVNNFRDKIAEIGKTLGFRREGDQLISPTAEDVQQSLGVAKSGQAKLLLGTMKRLQERLVNNEGQMSYDDMLSEYKRLGDMANDLDKANRGTVFKHLVDLKNGLREDINGWTGNLLQKFDPEAGAQYAKSLERFSNIKDAHDTLGSLIDKDAMTSEALLTHLIGKGNLDKLQAFKTLTQNESPDMWQNIVGGYFNKIKNAGYDAATLSYDWRKSLSANEAISPEIRQQLMGPEVSDAYDAFLRQAAKLSQESAESMKKPENTASLKLLIKSVASLHPWTAFTEAAGMLSKVGKNEAVARYFERADIDKLVAGLDPAKKAGYKRIINATIDTLKVKQAPVGSMVGADAAYQLDKKAKPISFFTMPAN